MVLLGGPGLQAQFEDRFSDGDFSNNPAWAGNSGQFIVNAAFELQLNASGAGVSTLYSSLSMPDSNSWEALIRMPFAPSGSNKLRFYLQADGPDFSNTNAYFIEIGESGSSDAIRFFRQTGSLVELVASATSGALANSVNLRLLVERRSGGLWNIKADYTGGQAPALESSFSESTFPGGAPSYLGFQCTYTASNSTKFYFDDIIVREIVADTEAPQLTALSVAGPQELQLRFSEPILAASVDAALFSVSPAIGGASDAFAIGNEQVSVQFPTPFQNGQTYTLHWSGISDAAGNTAGIQSMEFLYLAAESAQAGDLLLNEIMADPSESPGLPAFEYVELYNRSGKYLDLGTVHFLDQTSDRVLGSRILAPGAYLTLCANKDTSLFKAFGPVMGLSSFPSLTNSGETLSLRDADGNLLHQVTYSDSWYRDALKAQGGWSLELINPGNLCSGADNWIASNDPKGGTPGTANSVLDLSPDTLEARLLQVLPEGNQSLRLFFSKSLSPAVSSLASIFSLSPSIAIAQVQWNAAQAEQVVLSLDEPLQVSQVYFIRVSTGLPDCQGRANVLEQTMMLGLPESPAAGDLVINELLFNPLSGGSRYVELYNASQKILSFEKLFLANRKRPNDAPSLIQVQGLILPGQYVALSENPGDIAARYFVARPEWLYENDLPSMADKGDNLTLLLQDAQGSTELDAVDYSEDWQSPFLADRNGIALERVRADGPSQDPANWQSAASTAGFGTPTAANSQQRPAGPTSETLISIPENTFSPDGDGYRDFLLIQYASTKSGGTARIRIFDTQGRQVRQLGGLSLLGERGEWKWEGETDDQLKARIGIYTLVVDITYPDGQKEQSRNTCILAARL